MKNECKTELIEELLKYNNMTSGICEAGESLLQQEEKLDRLFSLFKEEMRNNIFLINNFPGAFKYVREVQHEFFCLLKYSLIKNSQGKFLKKKPFVTSIPVLYNSKFTEREYEEIKMRYSVCKQAIDYIVFKSCLLKELKSDYFTLPIVSGNKLKWNGSQTDLIEIIQFLYYTKLISKENGTLTLKEAISLFSRLFGLKITSIYSKTGKQRQRRQGKSTKIYQIWANYQQNKN